MITTSATSQKRAKNKNKNAWGQIQPLLWGDSASRIGHQRELCIQGVLLTFMQFPTAYLIIY
jgi:hypothetical protein